MGGRDGGTFAWLGVLRKHGLDLAGFLESRAGAELRGRHGTEGSRGRIGTLFANPTPAV